MKKKTQILFYFFICFVFFSCGWKTKKSDNTEIKEDSTYCQHVTTTLGENEKFIGFSITVEDRHVWIAVEDSTGIHISKIYDGFHPYMLESVEIKNDKEEKR